MSRERFDENCKGCRPVLLNPENMKPLPSGHAVMKAMEQAWSEATHETKAAFHRVHCLNSRDMLDVAQVQQFLSKVKARFGS